MTKNHFEDGNINLKLQLHIFSLLRTGTELKDPVVPVLSALQPKFMESSDNPISNPCLPFNCIPHCRCPPPPPPPSSMLGHRIIGLDSNELASFTFLSSRQSCKLPSSFSPSPRIHSASHRVIIIIIIILIYTIAEGQRHGGLKMTLSTSQPKAQLTRERASIYSASFREL